MPESTSSKTSAYLITAIFIAVILLPFLGTIFQIEVHKESTENRALAALPAKPNSIKTLKRYPQKFNLYFQDNFSFRKQLLWFNDLKYWVGDSPSKQVSIGKHGWLFFNGEPFTDLMNSIRGIKRFSENELEQYARALSVRHAWLKKRGIEYLLIIAPNKHSIYPEYLPDHLSKVRCTSITDQFVRHMKKHTTVPVLDLRPTLLDSKSPDTPLYFRSDTHWNHYGSNIAQFEIAKRLALYFPKEIVPRLYTKNDFLTNKIRGGDLAGLMGQKSQYTEDNPEPRLHACTQRPTPPKGDFSASFSTSCKTSALNVVVFRDSFFEYLYRYISLYFNQASFISKRIDYVTLKQTVEEQQPDVVIEEWAERFLPAIPEVDDRFVLAN